MTAPSVLKIPGSEPPTVLKIPAPARPAVMKVLAPGRPGPPGTPGTAGPEGPPGQPRWSGEGPPGLIIGAQPGDQYLDTLTGDVYTLM